MPDPALPLPAPEAPPPPAPPPLPDRIPIRTADGKIGTIPATSLQQARSAGAQVLSSEEYHQEDLSNRYQGSEGLALAFANQAARKASFGLVGAGTIPDLFDEAGAGARKEAIEASEELHPVGGFVGGMVGMAVNPVLGKLGAAAEGLVGAEGAAPAATALGRIGTKTLGLGARGAAENSALALGQALEDSQEHDTPIVGEKLAASMGYAALTGFAGGAALGAGTGVLAEARSASSPALRKVAAQAAASSMMPGHLSGVRLGREITQKLGVDGMRQLGEEALDRGIITPGADTEMKFLRTKAAKEEVGQQIGDLLNQVPAVGRPLEVYKLFDDAAAPYREKLGQSFVADQLDKLRDDFGRITGIVDGSGELAEDAATKTAPFEDLLKQRKAITEIVWRDIRTTPDAAKVDLKALRGVERGFESYLTDIADESEKYFDRNDFRQTYRGLKSSYQKLSFLEEGIGDKLAKETNRATFGLRDATMAAGALAGGHVSGALAAGLGMKAARTYGPQSAAWALNRVASMRAVAGEVSSFDRLMDRGVNLWLEQGHSTEVKPLFGHVAIGTAPEPERTLTERYDEHADQVRAALQHPDVPGEVAKGMGDFAHHAPAATAALQQTTVRAVQFLATKLPVAQPADPLRPSVKVRPSATQMAKFLRYAHAVDDPAGILEEISSRRLSPEAVEAIRAVYPSVWSEVQAKVINRIRETDAPMGYQARMQLAALFGVPAGPTLTQASRAASQAVYSAPAQSDTGPQPSNKGRKKAVDVGAFAGAGDSDSMEQRDSDKRADQ